jgi:MAF protein
MQPAELLLASNSPRRRQLLTLAGYRFVPSPVDIDESPLPGEPPSEYVLRLAREKAATAYHLAQNDQGTLLILAADTTVALDGAILSKPLDAAEAVDMLRRLRGRAHQGYTGLALITPAGQTLTRVCATRVFMRDYTDEEIDAYVASGDPMDKAGAYAIQHSGFHPVERLEGCYANIMGLPMCTLEDLLREAGLQPRLDLQSCPPDSHACPFCRSLAGGA